MEKLNTLKRILDGGLIAVIRAESTEKAMKIVDAVKAGGIDVIEITLTVPNAVAVIKQLCDTYDDSVLIGGGTVLDSETALSVIQAGAKFVVSPHLNVDVVRLCHRYQKVVIPGAMTIKEIIEAMESGADIVKFFPGSLFGPDAIKAIRGPLPMASLCPTGGVTLTNAADWIKAGAVCLGIGGELTKGAKDDDYDSITQTTKKFVKTIRLTRQALKN